MAVAKHEVRTATLAASRSDELKKPQAMAGGNSTVCHKNTPRVRPSRTRRLNNFDPYRCNSSRVILTPTMSTAAEYLLADIARFGNSPICDKTLPALKTLNARALDFADSLMPKGSSIDDLSDFEDALDELTGVIDNLDEACDAHDLAEDEDSKSEAFEMASQALVDLARSLQEVDPLAQYIESTEQLVLAKWGGELARITRLPTQQAEAALTTLLGQTRTPKESFILLSLATVALLKAGR